MRSLLKDEALLLEKVSEGDEIAFRAVFDYYYPKVITFLEYYIQGGDVKDVAQNIFAKIWLMRATLPEIRSFGAWLYRLSRNASVDYCRRKRIHISLSDNYQDIRDCSSDDEYFARERQFQYRNCLSQMPQRRRQVFEMSREEGLSNEEISLKLGISKKTVENHINAALRELRKILSSIVVFF